MAKTKKRKKIVQHKVSAKVSIAPSDAMDLGGYSLRQVCESAVHRKGLSNAQVGVFIAPLNHPDKPVYTYNADMSCVPASCMKLVTSAAVLDYLGPEYRFKTHVYQKGTLLTNGVLKGDLVIYGVGDPSMSDRYAPHKITAALEHLADQVAERGIRQVDGNIIGDGTYFDNQEIGTGWSFSYLEDWYAAKVTAIALNDNCLNFEIIGGKKPGAPASVDFVPKTRFMLVDNQVKTVSGRGRSRVSYTRDVNSDILRIKGTIGPNQRSGFMWASVNDPLHYAADVFREILIAKGIEVRGRSMANRYPNPTVITKDCQPVAMYESPPLKELLKAVNKNSQNLYAEMLVKTLGKVKYGQGSYEKGLKAVKDFLATTNADLKGYRQVDGCGLSPYNEITPRQLGMVLAKMSEHKYSQTYYDSMSIPGVDGSLRHSRLSDLTHQVRGKTGGIKGVRSLSGYITTRSGEEMVYSFMSNHIARREYAQAMENAVLHKLAEE